MRQLGGVIRMGPLRVPAGLAGLLRAPPKDGGLDMRRHQQLTLKNPTKCNFKNVFVYTKSMVTTDETVAKCEEAADAADDSGRKELAAGFRSAAGNLRGLQRLLDD